MTPYEKSSKTLKIAFTILLYQTFQRRKENLGKKSGVGNIMRQARVLIHIMRTRPQNYFVCQIWPNIYLELLFLK